jgi:potassium-dependent mechanosensitive channel
LNTLPRIIRFCERCRIGSGEPRLSLSLIFTVCLAAVAASAPADSAPDPAKTTTGQDFADKRAKLAERIAKLTAETAAAAPEKPAADGATPVDEELELLHALDLLYVQHEAVTDKRADVELEKKHLQDEADSLHRFGPAESKPYSFLLWEELREQLSDEQERAEAVASDLASAEQMLAESRESFEQCERTRRQAHEALAENKAADQKPTLDRELRLAELNSEIAQETVELCRSEIEVKTARRELTKARHAFLEEKLALVAKDVHYSEHDHHARILELTKRHEELGGKLKAAHNRLVEDESQKLKALAELSAQQADKAVVAAASEAFQTARSVHCEIITLVNQRLGELEQFQHFVDCRYKMMSRSATKEELAEWRTQLASTLERLTATERALVLRLAEIRVDQAALFARADDAQIQDERLKPWIDRQSDQLRELAQTCEGGLLHLKARHRSLERFQTDLEAAVHAATPVHPLATIRDTVRTVWTYELAQVGDQPITVGKISSGLLFLVAGVLLSRLISGLLGRRLLPRFGLNEGASNAVQAIVFYALCVLFGLVTLELVHVPFASFAFLGGAVAIAFGFGSQNILNNFMSGLILLVEQPIRVGDVVMMAGERGVVERIGARSTRLRTMANHEMIVPNSTLLEDKVMNLTLSDNLVQTVISVNLSPTLSVAEVRRRLQLSASAHPKVLANPEPTALLLSFSEKELAFELHFWIKMSNLMECRVVESDVRHAVSLALCNTDAASKTNLVAVVAEAKPAESAMSVKLASAKGPDGRETRKAG